MPSSPLAMDPHSQQLVDNYGLHQYAIIGDDEGLRDALRQGADVNALDSSGRTAVMCAVAGEHWRNIDASDASLLHPKRLNTIRTLLGHPDISLLTLNCPQTSMNGVVPLGMAAWLNLPQVTKLLLEESGDCISVDGMDSHGATALMYAARDGSLEVVQLLLSHGARPDFRDRNYRTSIQFALAHPRILWLLETVLRRHRWRETKSADRTKLSSDSDRLAELAYSSMPVCEDLEPPPNSIFKTEAISRLNNALISSIRRSDVSFIYSLLFAPALPTSSPPALYPMSVPTLVNFPDSNGWSLIHHCVSVHPPSIAILDALYCAGAEMALFTTQEQQSPLHILARSARVSGDLEQIDALHAFTLHLIQDLRSPLAARDKNDETCIHIAAEHGRCPELLALFLELDSTGAIREMKNSRGLNAMDVAKTEFLFVFQDQERPSTALSHYTIRATSSFASLASLSELDGFFPPESDTSSVCSTKQFDVHTSIQELLTNLRFTSPSISHPNLDVHVQQLEIALCDTQHHCDLIVADFRQRINDVTKTVDDLHKTAERIESIRRGVAISSKSRMASCGIVPLPSRRRQRDSEDSQATAVSSFSSVLGEDANDDTVILSVRRQDDADDASYASTGTQTALLDLFVNPMDQQRFDLDQHTASVLVLDGFVDSPESMTCKGYLQALWEVEREMAEIQSKSHTFNDYTSESSKYIARYKHLVKKKKKLEDKIRELDLHSKLAVHKKEKEAMPLSGTSRVKAWFKKMVVPSHPSYPTLPTKLEVVLDLDDQNCAVGREAKRVNSPSTNCGDAIDTAIGDSLKTSQIVLEAADRDLQSINQCLEFARQFIDMANHSVSRTQRVVKRSIKKREALIAELNETIITEANLKLHPELSPGLLGYTDALASRPSLSSICTIYSNRSSIISVAATLTENDDDETRIIRRLLLRKIEAQTSGAWDEVDKVMGWLSIVKEAVRAVKRRAYL